MRQTSAGVGLPGFESRPPHHAMLFLRSSAMERYSFTPRRGVVITPKTAELLLASQGCLQVPVNFGLKTITACVNPPRSELLLEHGRIEVATEVLARLVGSDKLLYAGPEGAYFLEVRERSYYKLRYLGEKVAPTLEINGIHMHNIVGTDPLSDARRKVELAGVRRGARVLDVCTGLGYTACQSLLRGASVVTVERDENVLWIAEHNPFSALLERAEIILGDAFEVLDQLEGESFDNVIHDPPTFALAGELYSLEFYLKLHRVMRKGARIFHYTGAPGKHRGLNLAKGVAQRLRRAGFTVERVIEGYGIVAVKN